MFCRGAFYLRATTIDVFSFRILKPFKYSVWTVCGVLLVSISLLLGFVLQWEAKNARTVSAFILSLGAFCQQGTDMIFTLSSTRIVSISLSLSSLLIYNFYTSVLVSITVGTGFEADITNQAQLVGSDIPIGFLNSSIVRNILRVL